MKTMVTLTHEEAQSYLAYALICETMGFGNAFATTDVFVNPRKGIPFVQCSTENQLSDFRKADSHE